MDELKNDIVKKLSVSLMRFSVLYLMKVKKSPMNLFTVRLDFRFLNLFRQILLFLGRFILWTEKSEGKLTILECL